MNQNQQNMEEDGSFPLGEVLEKAQRGDNDALELIIEHYKGMVRAKSRTYFLIGGDYEDLIQEGMIGLYKAIRDYRKERAASFQVFADLCITRQIHKAIKSATRQKHMPLNSYISLNRIMFENDGDSTLMDVLVDTVVSGPEEQMINEEQYNRMKNRLFELLTDLELQVFRLYLQGETYQEISESISKPVKTIDNALQRVKKKVEKNLLTGNEDGVDLERVPERAGQKRKIRNL